MCVGRGGARRFSAPGAGFLDTLRPFPTRFFMKARGEFRPTWNVSRFGSRSVFSPFFSRAQSDVTMYDFNAGHLSACRKDVLHTSWPSPGRNGGAAPFLFQFSLPPGQSPKGAEWLGGGGELFSPARTSLCKQPRLWLWSKLRSWFSTFENSEVDAYAGAVTWTGRNCLAVQKAVR